MCDWEGDVDSISGGSMKRIHLIAPRVITKKLSHGYSVIKQPETFVKKKKRSCRCRKNMVKNAASLLKGSCYNSILGIPSMFSLGSENIEDALNSEQLGCI